MNCNGPSPNDCLTCIGNNSPNRTACTNCTRPTVAGYEYLVHIDTVLNYISFTRTADSSSPMYLGVFPNIDRVFHWIVFDGAGSITFDQNISIFQNDYSTDIIFNGSTVSYQGNDVVVALGQKISASEVTDYNFTITKYTGYVCVGLKASFYESQEQLDSTGFGTGIAICAEGTDNVILQQRGSLAPAACTVCNVAPELCDYCSSGYYLQMDLVTCASTCPTGYWTNPISNICSACNSSCQDCTGSSNTQCTSCSSEYYLQPNSTSCLNTCPDGYFKDTQALTCDPCNSACSTCTGPNNGLCLTCQVGFYLQPDTAMCLTTCPSNYYQEASTQTCHGNNN